MGYWAQARLSPRRILRKLYLRLYRDGRLLERNWSDSQIGRPVVKFSGLDRKRSARGFAMKARIVFHAIAVLLLIAAIVAA